MKEKGVYYQKEPNANSRYVQEGSEHQPSRLLREKQLLPNAHRNWGGKKSRQAGLNVTGSASGLVRPFS